MAELLNSSSYHKSGAYIGQLIVPTTGSLATNARIPVMIGKSSRYMLSSNAEVIRAYVYDESIEFTASSPYTATLKHPALKDQSKASLVRVSDSYEIPENHWSFQDTENIIISEEDFVADSSYTFSYQSTDRAVLDPAPVVNISSIRSCGNTVSSNTYVENRDYFLVTHFSDIVKKGTLITASGLSFDSRYKATSLYATASQVSSKVGAGNGDVVLNVYNLNTLSFTSDVSIKVDRVYLSTSTSTKTYTLTPTGSAVTKTLSDLGITESEVYSISISGWTLTTSDPTADKEYSVLTTDGLVTGVKLYAAVTTPAADVTLSITYTHTKVLNSIDVTYEFDSDSFGSKSKSSMNIPNDGSLHTAIYGASIALTSNDGNSITWESFNGSYVITDGVAASGTADTFSWEIIPGKIFPTAKDNRTVTLKYYSKGTSTFTHLFSTVTGSYSTGVTVTSIADGTTPYIDYIDTYTATVSGVITSSSSKYLLVDVTHKYPSGINETVSFLLSGTLDNGIFTCSGGTLSMGNSVSIVIASNTTFTTATDATLFTFTHSCSKSSGTSYKWYYASTTQEGGFGTLETIYAKGSLSLPGNIVINVDATDLTVGDEFTFTFTNDDVLDWSLTIRTTDQFLTSQIYRDVNGTKTGTAGSYYVELSGVPISGISSVTTGITATLVTGTACVIVANSSGAKPTVTLSISYEYVGKEPEPSASYYISTLHVRPDSYYNKVIFISSRAEGEALLAPSTTTNDLYIANEISWDIIGSKTGYQIAYVQIQDSDEDGVITPSDVQNAIGGLATSSAVTDWTLLGNFGQINKLLSANEDGNDPFSLRENEVWCGCPVGTEVGDINTEGSIVYTAQNTLKVYGDNPAHGTRILVAPTEATKSVTMDSGSSQTITLDGSFVAFSVAVYRSTLGAADSIMRATLSCFDTIQVYDDVDNIKLGSAQIVYFSKQGTGIYRIEEDFTTDKYSFEFSLEQITSQRLQVVRDIRSYMDEKLIGYTPDTPASGVNDISSFLVRGLNQEITNGVISPYQDENGKAREIDPAKDIFVKVVTGESNKYQFGYGFYTKKAIKLLYGTYVVDQDFSDTGLGS